MRIENFVYSIKSFIFEMLIKVKFKKINKFWLIIIIAETILKL